MGSPKNPTLEQIDQLEQAGQLELFTSPQYMQVKDGKLTLNLDLPRQGVALFKVEFMP